MLYNPTKSKEQTITPRIRLRGQYLARNRLDKQDKAKLVKAIADGKAEIDASSLTIGQLCRLCGVSRTYVDAVRFTERVKRARQRRLAEAFSKIPFDCRVELCRAIGAERVWAALSAAID